MQCSATTLSIRPKWWRPWAAEYVAWSRLATATATATVDRPSIHSQLYKLINSLEFVLDQHVISSPQKSQAGEHPKLYCSAVPAGGRWLAVGCLASAWGTLAHPSQLCTHIGTIESIVRAPGLLSSATVLQLNLLRALPGLRQVACSLSASSTAISSRSKRRTWLQRGTTRTPARRTQRRGRLCR